MKITFIGPVTANEDGHYCCPIQIGAGGKAKKHLLEITNSSFDPDAKEPTFCIFAIVKASHLRIWRSWRIDLGGGEPIEMEVYPPPNLYVSERMLDVLPPNVEVKGVHLYWGLYVGVFRRKTFKIDNSDLVPNDEIVLRIKHAAFKLEKELNQVQKEVAAFENFERLPSARRERIPESVRLFVWQRDGGHCVRCGSNERLEFDHIIPVIEGGSSTERNVQLLCESCNRAKGKTV